MCAVERCGEGLLDLSFAIVLSSFVRIGEYFVGGRDLAKLFSGRSSWIYVGVIATGKDSVGTPDLFAGRS
jgi:hypothetical protein